MKPVIRLLTSGLALFLLAQAQPSAPPAAKTSVAVYPLKAVGAMDKSIAATFSSLLNHELTQSPKLIVIKESQLEEVMKRQAMNISDACDDTVCQVEIGKLVQAQKMITGELSKMGSIFFLTLDVVDVRSGALEWSGKEKCSCTEDQLELLVAAAGAQIRNYFGEQVPIPALPVGQAFVPVQPSAVPQAPTQKTFQEFHPPNTKGGPMVLVSDFKFYIDKFEVTNQDYQECVSAGVCQETKKKSGLDASKQPVAHVDQEDARNYCQWAGKRLPKEQEWQEAAQGTDGRIYPWGNDSPNCNLANYKDYSSEGCREGGTLPVGSKPAGASPYGGLDMAGNVDEWVEENGVLRGGDWDVYPMSLRVANRVTVKPGYRGGFAKSVGFRCARDGS
jgi:formylglycine-generating enzyme required for sulfatase activity